MRWALSFSGQLESGNTVTLRFEYSRTEEQGRRMRELAIHDLIQYVCLTISKKSFDWWPIIVGCAEWSNGLTQWGKAFSTDQSSTKNSEWFITSSRLPAYSNLRSYIWSYSYVFLFLATYISERFSLVYFLWNSEFSQNKNSLFAASECGS